MNTKDNIWKTLVYIGLHWKAMRHLWSTDESKFNKVGMTWEWVNVDRILGEMHFLYDLILKIVLWELNEKKNQTISMQYFTGNIANRKSTKKLFLTMAYTFKVPWTHIRPKLYYGTAVTVKSIAYSSKSLISLSLALRITHYQLYLRFHRHNQSRRQSQIRASQLCVCKCVREKWTVRWLFPYRKKLCIFIISIVSPGQQWD